MLRTHRKRQQRMPVVVRAENFRWRKRLTRGMLARWGTRDVRSWTGT